MLTETKSAQRRTQRPEWHNELAAFEKPDTRKALLQLTDTMVPYAGLWVAMVAMLKLGVSFWLTLPVMMIAAGLLVRIFIFFHDCGHDCFFPSRRWNRIVGYVTGIMAFTPFDDWKQQHAMHHAGAGDLERRGAGDVWTMTVEEYVRAPWHLKLGYRFYRNPLVLFGIGPLWLFFVAHRFPHKASGPRGLRSVVITNIALAAIFTLAYFTIGLKTYLMIQLPVMAIAGMAGVWMFYVQHQYERVYWERHPQWDPVAAALEGSSYYKLPRVLQWFSGNIGLHHIHHLRARIPNYNLQRCYDKVEAMQRIEPLTLLKSLHCIFMNLWDERTRNMVSFRALRARG